MCEDKDCDCNHHQGHHGRYHRHHMKGYTSIDRKGCDRARSSFRGCRCGCR